MLDSDHDGLIARKDLINAFKTNTEKEFRQFIWKYNVLRPVLKAASWEDNWFVFESSCEDVNSQQEEKVNYETLKKFWGLEFPNFLKSKSLKEMGKKRTKLTKKKQESSKVVKFTPSPAIVKRKL